MSVILLPVQYLYHYIYKLYSDLCIFNYSLSLFRFPEWHLQSISVRKGCVIVELNMVSLSGCLGESSISDLRDWLNVMQLQNTLNLDTTFGNVVSMKVISDFLIYI